MPETRRERNRRRNGRKDEQAMSWMINEVNEVSVALWLGGERRCR